MFLKNVLILFFFIIKFHQISSLIIPLHSSKNFSNSNSILEILDSYKNDLKYSFIEIGVPPQKFQIIFLSQEGSNMIKGEKCFPNSFYDISISKTNEFRYEINEQNYFYIDEYISFDKNYHNLLMHFIYYNSTIITKENCGNIGFGLSLKAEQEHNLFLQLKKLNVINKAIFYFNYSYNNNDMSLNIGLEPYDLDNTFLQNATRIGIDPMLDYDKKGGKYREYNWNLNFSKIFYFRKLPLQASIDPYVEITRWKARNIKYFQALLMPEEELIKGPYEYQLLIEETFFDALIKDKICQKIKFENKCYFYCQKEHKNLLKNTFPSLYFFNDKLNYMFELTYDDLFFEQGDFIFFGIYFDRVLIEVYKGAFISEWYLGKLFLKKYLFGFDFEKKELIFYKKTKAQKNKNEDNKNNEKDKSNNSKKILQLGLILVIIAIGVFAFLLDRYAKRKHKVNSLLIDFNSNNNKCNDNKNIISP